MYSVGRLVGRLEEEVAELRLRCDEQQHQLESIKVAISNTVQVVGNDEHYPG